MSFGDLESGNLGSQRAAKTRPEKWCVEEQSFEQQIRANIQKLQENVRSANEQLERSHRACMSKRGSYLFNQSSERGRELAQETEQLFRDWTVHLAGEPTERHKKKFSYEKLQKAFGEEVGRLKEAGRRAIVTQQEALHSEGRYAPASPEEFRGMCEDQGSSVADEEDCLLAGSASEVTAVHEDGAIESRLALEREEGIKRIQSQVTEVNQMFRDLASIVSEQGQQFESIEQQAETAVSNTKQATQELKKTSDRQRSHFERLCCMLLAAMLLLCFALVSSVPHLRGGHPVA